MKDNNKQQQSTPLSKKHSSRKKRWIVSFVLILVLCGVIVAWFVVTREKKTTPQTQDINKATSQTVSDAQALANNGKVDAAKAAYDAAAKNTNDNDQKSIFLSQKATLLFNNAQYEEALVVALEAESAKKDATAEGFIAQIYEKKGDKQKAIEYYQSALVLVDKSQPTSDVDIQYYQSVIRRLGGVVK